jgi:hypothetical protein
MTKDEYLHQRNVIQADLLAKHNRNDMHGVADAAMDTRDLDKYYTGFKDGYEAGLEASHKDTAFPL